MSVGAFTSDSFCYPFSSLLPETHLGLWTPRYHSHLRQCRSQLGRRLTLAWSEFVGRVERCLQRRGLPVVLCQPGAFWVSCVAQVLVLSDFVSCLFVCDLGDLCQTRQVHHHRLPRQGQDLLKKNRLTLVNHGRQSTDSRTVDVYGHRFTSRDRQDWASTVLGRRLVGLHRGWVARLLLIWEWPTWSTGRMLPIVRTVILFGPEKGFSKWVIPRLGSTRHTSLCASSSFPIIVI